MNDTLEREGFEERLLPMLLLAAGSTKSPWRRRGPLMGSLVAAALITGVVFVGIAAGRGETVPVDGMKALRDPSAVERELADEGINATIVVVPLPARDGDYWNGRWYSLYFDQAPDISQEEFDHLYFQVGRGNGTEQIQTSDGTIGADQVKVLELPKDLSGHITLSRREGRSLSHSQPSPVSIRPMNCPRWVRSSVQGLTRIVRWPLERCSRQEAIRSPGRWSPATLAGS